jgi:hypothetical protein
MTLNAPGGPPVVMTSFMAVTALAAEPPEIGVLVAEEAGRLTMPARQGNGMLGPGDLLPHLG